MKIFRYILSVWILIVASATSQTVVFNDAFDRGSVVQPISNGGVPTATYTTATTGTGSPSPTGNTSRTNSQTLPEYALQILSGNTSATPNAQTAGRTYVTAPLSTYSSPFVNILTNNTEVITWTFNMKTNRTTALSGFTAGSYASVVILAATAADFTAATTNGWCVVEVKGTTTNTIKLGYFTNGLLGSGTVGNINSIIAPATDFVPSPNTDWISVKVTYDPNTDTWALFLRDDGSLPVDPSSGTLGQQGSNTVNTTFTTNTMTNFGFYLNGSAGGSPTSNTALYDNFKVTTSTTRVPTIAPTNLMLGTLIAGGASQQVGWVPGNGNKHLVVVRANADVNFTPVNSTTYAPNAAFGSGTDVAAGSGDYVVYNGGGSSVNITGLNNSTVYYIKVFEYNGAAGSELYYIASPLASSFNTVTLKAIASGLWSATTTWATGVVPTLSDMVNIVSPYTVTVDNAATQYCAGLIVDNGATLIANGSNVGSTSQKALRLYGDVINNGTIGLSDGTDGLRFDIYKSTGATKFSGSGVTKLTKIVPIVLVPELKFSQNVTLYYQASAGSGGTGLLINYAQGQTFSTITVDAGVTLSFNGTTSMGTSAVASDLLDNFTGNISGTVSLGGSLGIRAGIGTTSSFNVLNGGTVTVGNYIYPSSLTSGLTTAITVTGTGLLTANGTCDFGSAIVTGTGTFTLGSGATINIGSTTGLEPIAGPIRTTTRNFNTSANYSFVGTSAQVPGSDFPATIKNLTISNPAGVTFSKAQSVTGSTNVNSTCTLAIGGGTLTLAGTPAINGTFQINQGGWATGGIWSYTSGTLIFNNTSGGTYTVNSGDVFWPTTNGPTNITVGTQGITLNSASRIVAGIFQTFGPITNANNLTINGICQINTGGSLTGSPSYGGASTLIYNIGTIYNVGNEWGSGTTVGSGVPQNITIQTSGTNVTKSSAGSCPGTLTINPGCTLAVGGSLTNIGTFSVNGTFQLNSGGSVASSPVFGSGSTLIYNAGGGFGAKYNQSLEWPGSNGPDNVTLKNNSWVQLQNDINLPGNLTITNGALQSLGTHTLTMSGATQTITVSTTSSGAIYGTDNNPGNDLSLQINSGSSTTFTGDATTSNDDEKKFYHINVDGTLALSRGILCKYGTFTVSSTGKIQINANGYIQQTSGVLASYSSGGTLIYANGGTYTSTDFEWPTSNSPSNVTINSASTNVTLNNSKSITGVLTLTSGILTLGAFDLTLSNAISGGGSTSYICANSSGLLKSSVGSLAVTFPVGYNSTSDYTPITFSNTGTSRLYGVTMKSITPNTTGSHPAGLLRQWFIKELSHPDNTIFNSMTVAWNSDDNGSLSNPTGTCDIVANKTGSVDGYDLIYKAVSYSGYSAVVSDDHPFNKLQDIQGGLYVTVLQDNSLLPVELSTFTSNANGREIQLNWETKTEKNSNKFEIERSILDGINWTVIGTVKAADLSNSPKQYSFIEKNLQSGKYDYRLKMIDNDGTYAYSKVVEAIITLPKNFDLSQNYPNPFNPSTKINYNLPFDSKVTMDIYSSTGEKVGQILNEEKPAGYYTVDFNNNSNYRNLSSGIYLYRISVVNKASGDNFSSIKKMVLLK